MKLYDTSIQIKGGLGIPNLMSKSPIWVDFNNGNMELGYLKDGFSFGKKLIILKPEDVSELSFSQESSQSLGSAAKGALIGGLLTGGIGLLAGAAIGGRKKNENKIIFKANINNISTQIILNTEDKTQKVYDKINTWLNKV